METGDQIDDVNTSATHNTLVDTFKGDIDAIFYKLLEGMIMKPATQKISDQQIASLLTNAQFLLSIVGFSAQIVIYVFNYKHIRFDQFLEAVQLTPFDFWRSMDAFFDIDDIPLQLVKYFKELERQILSEMVWRGGTEIPNLIEQHLSESHDEETNHTARASVFEEMSKMENVRYQKFCQKTVHRATYLISSLSQTLGLPAYIQERIWDMIRIVFKEQIYLLVNRILDQVLLCSIYAVCKISADTKKLTFNHIISKYVDWYKAETLMSLVYSENHFEKMFQRIYMDELNDGDIMAFYNRKYVPTMKAYLIQLNSQAKPVKEATKDLQSRMKGMNLLNDKRSEIQESASSLPPDTLLKNKTLPYQVKSQHTNGN